eukprot:gnl/MRDRNA2_/MRDRNA2_31197_c0_seq1.p1 gnl/MRDRNA2_/MRDRNA2_31197_c0~~gnl/MRDRNA2_/MRDRNA2_31197_c0_seq1.p1  ORF type:complete len:235 (+),score=46.37 gnl/MRDRNA2_/MRDRNA2_31197_c0_seq1:140-844(+)
MGWSSSDKQKKEKKENKSSRKSISPKPSKGGKDRRPSTSGSETRSRSIPSVSKCAFDQRLDTNGRFEAGTRVMIGGLKNPEMNGKIAVVFSYDENSGRYVVELESGFGGQKAIRPENLTARGSATGVVAARARAALTMQTATASSTHSQFCGKGATETKAAPKEGNEGTVAARDKKFDALDADLHVQIGADGKDAEGPMARLSTMPAGLGLKYGPSKGYGPCGDSKSSHTRSRT